MSKKSILVSRIKSILILGLVISSFALPVYADEPKLVSGTLALLTAATSWLTGLIPVGSGLFLGYHAWLKSMSEDQAIIAEKNRLMKNVLIGAAIATTASGLARIILGFYS